MIECIKNILFIPKDKLLYGYFIYFFVFIAYLELSPNLGNMWLRTDSMGIKRFHPYTIVRIILKPLVNLSYWSPLLWDINFFIGGYFFSKLLYYFNYI
jgi:hypothetical protein